MRRAAALVALALLLPAALDEVNDLNDRARAALDAGHPDQAVPLLQKALALSPDEPVLKKNLAWAFYQRGQQAAAAWRSNDALADWKQAWALNPEEPGYADHAGQLLLRQYRLDEAATLMRDATKRHADHADAWLLLGQTLSLQGELDDAVEAFGQAVAHGTGQVVDVARDAATRAAREQQIEKDYRLDKTPYFDILGPIDTQGPQFGTRLAATLERARAQVCSDLAVYPQHRATVVLYPPDAFRAATGTHEWVGGLFDRKIRLPIADVERDADKIESAFRHEYTHLIVSEVSPGCPTFVNEGLAQVMEYGRGTGIKRLTGWLDQRQGGRSGLPKIADLPGTFLDISDPDAVTLAYLVSHAFVDQLVANHGTGPVLTFVRALDSQPLDEAFQATFRRSLADQEEMFQQAVKSAR